MTRSFIFAKNYNLTMLLASFATFPERRRNLLFDRCCRCLIDLVLVVQQFLDSIME